MSQQIDDRLFLDLCAYFLYESDDPRLYQRICRALSQKLDSAVRRVEYSKRLEEKTLLDKKDTDP